MWAKTGAAKKKKEWPLVWGVGVRKCPWHPLLRRGWGAILSFTGLESDHSNLDPREGLGLGLKLE